MQYAWQVIRNDLSGGEVDEWDGEKYGTQIEQGDYIKLGRMCFKVMETSNKLKISTMSNGAEGDTLNEEYV